MRKHELPCETCDRQIARCSTTCKRLHDFLRWTDKNRANILGKEAVYREHEVAFEPEILKVISDKQVSNETHPDISVKRLFTASIDYGAIDTSCLKRAEEELFKLYYCQQFTAQQLADMWGLSSNAIHMRLKRIRKKIYRHYIGKLNKAYPDTP